MSKIFFSFLPAFLKQPPTCSLSPAGSGCSGGGEWKLAMSGSSRNGGRGQSAPPGLNRPRIHSQSGVSFPFHPRAAHGGGTF